MTQPKTAALPNASTDSVQFALKVLGHPFAELVYKTDTMILPTLHILGAIQKFF